MTEELEIRFALHRHYFGNLGHNCSAVRLSPNCAGLGGLGLGLTHSFSVPIQAQSGAFIVTRVTVVTGFTGGIHLTCSFQLSCRQQ